MDKLLTLLTLQRQAQEAASRTALLHIIANESRKLLPYRQVIVWTTHAGQVTLETISGNAVLDQHGAYAQNIKKEIKVQNAKSRSGGNISEIGQDESGTHRTLVPFVSSQAGLLGGMYLETDVPLSDSDKELAAELAKSYAPFLELFDLRSRGAWHVVLKQIVQRKYIVPGLLVLALFPVRLSVTASVEIVPEDAEIITAPFSGIIQKVEVTPGNEVVAGDVVVTMDSTSLEADAELAGQDLKLSSEQISKARRQALSITGKQETRPDIGRLEAEREEKEIKFRYANEMREKSRIKASRSGVAIFTDKTILEGQPVQAGDEIMKVADPKKAEALVRIPVGALIPFDETAPVTFFLSVNPLGDYSANITSIGYEASPDADGLLSYKVRASIPAGRDIRIGWKGTARIKGHWTVLSYAVLRRPILSVRQMLGI